MTNTLLPFLEFRNISKRFGIHWANQDVCFSIRKGSFHGIVGENGAGKSTIMNIAYGLLQADSGQIFQEGKPVSYSRPSAAIAAGIGMVHQHFMQVPALRVWENIILGHEPQPYPRRPAKLLEELRELQGTFGFDFDLQSRLEDLGVGQQQQVELLKLLYRNSQLIVLDEPTALLTPQESDSLFEHLHLLQEQGRTLILISHKLTEILTHTDTVTVMKSGKVITTDFTQHFNIDSLSSLMMGKAKEAWTKPVLKTQGTPVLELDSVQTSHSQKTNLNCLSLHLFGGEILGLVGIENQGQEVLVEVLNQLCPFSGSISYLGQPLNRLAPYDLRQRGFSIIPLKRIEEGLISEMSIEENLILGHHHEASYLKSGWFALSRLTQEAAKRIQEFDIRPQNPHHTVKNLSGGNQQKLVVARETDRKVSLLVACHPTRGVDIQACESIHRQLINLAQKGAAILLISSDLDELFKLSSRLLVLRQGRVVFESEPSQTQPQELGLWMTGAKA